MAFNQVLNDSNELPDPAVLLTPRAASLFKNFDHTIQQIVKYYVLNKAQETVMDNLVAVFMMAQEFGDTQIETLHNFYTFNDDALVVEAYLDPVVSEAEFDDEYLTSDMEWTDKTTLEERAYFETDIGLTTGALLDALTATRSHTRYILSYDIKRILEDFEFHIRQHLN